MTSWIITDADRDEFGRIKVGDDPPPADSTEAQPVPERAPARPDTRITSFLPSVAAPAAPAPRRRRRLSDVLVLAGVVALIVLAGVILWHTEPVASERPVSSAPSAVSAQSTPAPTLPPQPTPQPPLAASWAPGGALTLSIDRTAVERPVARYGDAWVLVSLTGGGEVWVAPGDLGLSPAEVRALRDLIPPPTPIVVERVVEVPAACGDYAYVLEVKDDRGVPLGTVTGRSCASQAEAMLRAEALAAEMRAR